MGYRRNLKTERDRHHFTQEQMESMLGISTRQYRQLEYGTSDGSVKVWLALSKLFNKPINYLLEQVDDKQELAPK